MVVRRVRSVDIAEAAGVSRATVSYVLNGRRDNQVSDATRQHVRDVAARLGYISSPAATALRNGRPDVVLLLLPEWEVAGQLELLLEETGRLVAELGLVVVRHEGPHWRGRLSELLGKVAVACIVTFEPLAAQDGLSRQAAAVPEVRAWLLDTAEHSRTTAIGQADIVASQIDHLVMQGYRHLAYLAVEEPRGAAFTSARSEAFDQICQERGLRHYPATMAACTVADIAAVLDEWISGTHEPLGVAAWNDVVGLGLLSAARRLDLDVPNACGVIGGDDSPTAALSDPGLSSVRFNLVDEARRIAVQVARAVNKTTESGTPAAPLIDVLARRSTQLQLDH